MSLEKLTLIIPAKNEEESLPLVLDELKKYNVKKIVIIPPNDHKTYNAIEKYDCKILFQKNNGFGAAIIEGFNNSETYYSCIFNADGSFDPASLQEMYDLLEDKNNQLDFIFNSRYTGNGGSDDDTIITKIGNFFFTGLCNVLFRTKASDVLYTYVMGKTKYFLDNNLKCYDFTLCVELVIKAKKNRQNYFFLNSYERSRLKGIKKVNEFKDGFLILIYMIKQFFGLNIK